MTRLIFFSWILLLAICSPALKAQSPPVTPLPEKLKDLPKAIQVNHFPTVVPAIAGGSKDDFAWYWKHTTSVLASEETKIIECGAYLHTGTGWWQRVQYTPKQFSKLFSCPKAVLRQGQPYTFSDNWRTDQDLRPGWAAWYFIGTNSQGNKVFGWGPVLTSDKIY